MKPVRYVAVAVLACIATFLFLRYVVSPSDLYGRELYSADDARSLAATSSLSSQVTPSPTPDLSLPASGPSPSSVSNSDVVYLAGKGKKTFHKTPTCSGMKDPIAIPFSETRGMNPCKKCFPDGSV